MIPDGGNLWQYQAKAEPPRDPLIAPEMGWFATNNQPVFDPPNEGDWRVYGTTVVFLTEPIHMPPMLDWWQPTQVPSPSLPSPVIEGGRVGPLAPSLFVTISYDWLRGTECPVFFPEQPIEGGSTFLVDESVLPPELDTWWRQPSEPVFVPHQTEPGWWSGVLEPTLLVVQDLSWIPQTNEPVREAPELVREGSSLFDYKAILPAEARIDWYVQSNLPVFEAPDITEFDTPFQVEPTLVTDWKLDWLPKPNQPVQEEPRLVSGGLSVLVRDPIVITVWTPASVEPPYKLFLYTASRWSQNSFIVQAMMKRVSGSNPVRVRVYDKTGGTDVSGSEGITDSASYVLVQGGEVNLEDGHEYFIQFGKDTSDQLEGYGAELVGFA
jgi:hypothetical protein